MSVMLVSTNGGDFLLLLPAGLLVSDEVDIGWELGVELLQFSLAWSVRCESGQVPSSVVLLVNFNELLFDAVTDGCTTHHLVELGPVRTNDQESGVKVELVGLDQGAVVLLLQEGQAISEGWVVSSKS